MASVYRKTAKGLSEIETRANRLVPRLRTSLILVDGRRTDDDLRSLILAEPDAVLATLLAEGYIELIASTPPVRIPGAIAPTPTPTTSKNNPSDSRRFDEFRRLAVRFLNDQLGPSAESVALKIERARDWAELKPQLEMAEHFLRAGRGVAVSREFAAKFVDQSPS